MNSNKSCAHHPKIFSPMATGNGAYVVHRLLEEKISGYRIKSYNPYQTLFPPLLLKHMKGINKNNTDIIHTTPDYGFFFYKKDIPLVLTLHNFVLDRFMFEYSSLMQNIHYMTDLKLFTSLALNRATKITAVSNYTAKLAKDFFGLEKDIEVIHNGVDCNKFVPNRETSKNKKEIKVLYAGNLTIRKGVNFLPGIVKLLDSNISVFCTGGLRKETPRSIDLSNINMLGNIPYEKMPKLYPEFDILLMPTVREGLPLVVLEAMACGLPVIATDCSSLPELIDNEKGGYLCELGATAVFAEKINLLAASQSLRTDMGEYNRNKVESLFTLHTMINSYNNLFEKITLNTTE